MKRILLSTLPVLAATIFYAQVAMGTGLSKVDTAGGTVPTITYTGANCVGSASAVTASCTLAAIAPAGDLLVITSKTAAPSSNDAKAVLTFSGAASCKDATQVIAPGNAVWQTN